MRNHRQFVGAFVMAMTFAALLGTATPASAATTTASSSGFSTCAFLQGILYRISNERAADKLASVFDKLFGCELSGGASD